MSAEGKIRDLFFEKYSYGYEEAGRVEKFSHLVLIFQHKETKQKVFVTLKPSGDDVHVV